LKKSSPPAPPLITLTTDFGTRDPYVGSMKGVLLSMERNLVIVDISHDLPPHEILPAALLLREACPRFPAGTIHLAVVDPGVGGRRRPLLLKIRDRYYLGPDNGLFALLVRDFGMQGAWQLTDPRFFLPAVSPTFHGRDLFAPVAAHLAGGVQPESFGPAIDDPARLQVPVCRVSGQTLAGVVIWVDHFGNCVTNLPEAAIRKWAAGSTVRVRAVSREIGGISPTYESTAPGAPLALIGGTGYLEIACNQARADRRLRLRRGARVTLVKPQKKTRD